MAKRKKGLTVISGKGKTRLEGRGNMGRPGKDGMIEFSTEGMKFFDVLKRPAEYHGTFLGEETQKSKFASKRRGSPNFGKKQKTNYGVMTPAGKVMFSESSGPLQDLFDQCTPGDYVEIDYLTCALPSGELMPSSVKTKEQLWKWRGGKKEPSYPKFSRLALKKK
jgi:hypothetical protein